MQRFRIKREKNILLMYCLYKDIILRSFMMLTEKEDIKLLKS